MITSSGKMELLTDFLGFVINRYKRIGYSLDIIRQTACLVITFYLHDGGSGLRLNDDLFVNL